MPYAARPPQTSCEGLLLLLLLMILLLPLLLLLPPLLFASLIWRIHTELRVFILSKNTNMLDMLGII